MTRDDKFKLSWFPFYPEDYQRDTQHLDGMGHGAYILLLIAYYSSGRPPLDNDLALRTITKLTAEEWQAYRPLLAYLFDVRDGFWFHKRCEAELDKAYRIHQESVAGGKKGAERRYGHEGGKSQPTPAPKAGPKAAPIASHKTTPTPRPRAPPAGEAISEPIGEGVAPLQPHPYTLTSTSTKKGSSSTTDATKALDSGEGVGNTIDPIFELTEAQIEICHADGATDAQIDGQVNLFIAYNINKNTFSPDWGKTWNLWWQRYLERRTKDAARAPPRIEVNAGPARAEIGYKPSEAEFDRAAMLFAQNASHWSSQMGPEPGMLGCKCPPEILTKHGIDPNTGLKIREPAK